MSYSGSTQAAAGCGCSGLGQDAPDATLLAAPVLFGAVVVTLAVIGWGIGRADQPRRNRRRRAR